MGGFGPALARGAEDVMGKAYEKLSSDKGGFGKFAIDAFWSMGRTFKDTPVGEVVEGMLTKGIKARNDIGDHLTAPLKQFKGEVKNDRQLALGFDYKRTPLAQLHNSLPTGPAKAALSPLMAESSNHSLTLSELENKMHTQANLHGREVAFGPDGRNLAATLYPMLTSQGTDKTKAEAMLAVLSQIFRDTEAVKKGAGGVFQSGIKSDVQDFVTGLRKQYYGTKEPFPMNLEAEHVKGGGLEAAAHKYSMNYLAPFIAGAHLADFYKVATVPAQVLMKTLQNMNDPQIEQLKLASGIFFHTAHSIYDNDFNYRTGKLAKVLKSPDAAALIHKLYHQPLFNNVRMLQLSTFGSAAYHSAQMWGKQAVHGDLRAIEELKEMHLDHRAIIARNGDLTSDELTQAIWHYTNNRLFIDKPEDRSRFAQKTPFMRVASMFHGYVTKEGMYLTRELQKLMRSGDYIGLAHFAGVVGIVFPATAPLLFSAQTLVRTLSVEKAKEKMDEYYGGLIHPDGISNFALTYLELLGHFGAAGAFMQYIHAASNHRLAANILGPVPGVGVGMLEDIVGAIKGTKSGEHNLDPLARDFLRYSTVPIFGNWASEHLVPKKEKGLGLPAHFRRGRRR